tara:strand:- start:43 stop:213 length:171 start_codon:yes stop_codon:yes gene_type:complete
MDLPNDLINEIIMMSRPTYPWLDEYYRRGCRFITDDEIDFIIFYFENTKIKVCKKD